MKRLCKRCNQLEVHYMNGGRPRYVCKNCWREGNKKYYKIYLKRNPAIRNKIMHTYNFGGNREATILRDGSRCVGCNLSRTNHKIIYCDDITVDHIDGDRQNNKMTNLQTLCRRCHGKKDGARAYSRASL